MLSPILGDESLGSFDQNFFPNNNSPLDPLLFTSRSQQNRKKGLEIELNSNLFRSPHKRIRSIKQNKLKKRSKFILKNQNIIKNKKNCEIEFPLDLEMEIIDTIPNSQLNNTRNNIENDQVIREENEKEKKNFSEQNEKIKEDESNKKNKKTINQRTSLSNGEIREWFFAIRNPTRKLFQKVIFQKRGIILDEQALQNKVNSIKRLLKRNRNKKEFRENYLKQEWNFLPNLKY